MAVKGEFDSILTFEDWYTDYRVDPRDNTIAWGSITECAFHKTNHLRYFKNEADARLQNYWKYEKVADAAVVDERPDLPNVSSGEAAGFIRRIARAVVQHTPNISITSTFDDDDVAGVIATYIAKSKIIGDDEYSNNMQQQLYGTMIRAGALGFDCVIPALMQNNQGGWYTQYDNIHYRDVYPEPGVKDIRRANEVFVRRYLTRSEIHTLIRSAAPGWDIAALKTLLQTTPQNREYVDQQSKKHSVNSYAYEIMTWYSNSGEPFLTWHESTKMLLRIEKNKHPNKEHPVFFFVPEYDGQQPYGRSLVSMIYGRQSFQDWFLNGAMKLWRLNIEPPIIGYGVVNTIPNIGPGKYTSIPNPNAKVVPFETNTQTLLMFNQIAQANAGNMGQMIGATDQQMAAQNGAPGGMSQTPQGVEAQQQMVDVMTNNYIKSMESFVSRYTSYALTVYFQELKSVKFLSPSAEARQQLINAGMPPEAFMHEAHKRTNENGETVDVKEDGTGLKNGQIKADFTKLAIQYYVKTVPGSLTELEDEKQIRILNQLLVPLSQAMGAIGASGDREAVAHASAAIQFITQKQIELSGSSYSTELKEFLTGDTEQAKDIDTRTAELERQLGGQDSDLVQTLSLMAGTAKMLQEQVHLLTENQQALAAHVGVQIPSSAPEGGDFRQEAPIAAQQQIE